MFVVVNGLRYSPTIYDNTDFKTQRKQCTVCRDYTQSNKMVVNIWHQRRELPLSANPTDEASPKAHWAAPAVQTCHERSKLPPSARPTDDSSPKTQWAVPAVQTCHERTKWPLSARPTDEASPRAQWASVQTQAVQTWHERNKKTHISWGFLWRSDHRSLTHKLCNKCVHLRLSIYYNRINNTCGQPIELNNISLSNLAIIIMSRSNINSLTDHCECTQTCLVWLFV